MKDPSMLRTLVFAALTASLILVACGGGDSHTDTQTPDLGQPDTGQLPDILPADHGTDPIPGDEGMPDTWTDSPDPGDNADTLEVTDIPTELELPATLGGDRPAAVHVPAQYTPDKAWPLLILLHGFGANGFVQDIYLGISARVDKLGFIELVPEGTVNDQGHQFWDATDFCCNHSGEEVDDVAYLTSLIDEASAAFNIDPGRVYLAGHSNGGFMALRMACERSERITAIASIAGSMFLDEADCTPSQPVSVLLIHGTEDTDVTYEGKPLGGLGYPGAEETFERWRILDGCSVGPTEGDPLEYDDYVDGPETLPVGWSDCDQETRVDLWKMVGTIHLPTFTDDFRDDMLKHLLDLERPTVNPR